MDPHQSNTTARHTAWQTRNLDQEHEAGGWLAGTQNNDEEEFASLVTLQQIMSRSRQEAHVGAEETLTLQETFHILFEDGVGRIAKAAEQRSNPQYSKIRESKEKRYYYESDQRY